MKLGQMDLNLLVVLDALLREKNVTRAAERLHMSQPAISPALARLRKRYPQHPVRAGWDLAAENIENPDHIENLEDIYAKSS